jgi:phage terminase large subunit GpA-like protein
MIKAEFICPCGFRFEEVLHENEVSRTEDFERFYVRCPRCGEEASLRSWERGPEKSSPRKIDDF